MTPLFAWMIGWTIFAMAGGAAFLAVEAGLASGIVITIVAAGGTAGMTWGAWQAAAVRRPDDTAGAARQAVAWAVAGVFAFGLFALSFDSSNRAAGGALPPNYQSVVRLLVWFGAVGGFLAVAAASDWALPFRVFVRGVVSAVVWSGLVLGCGVAAIFGIIYGGHLLADALGSAAALVVAGLLAGLASGLFLGGVGEEANRRTFRFSA